ncbi:hypothetical protein [Flagellimonas sp.]|uniref:hypothetical protein n=1 Tax=Flagellimonas sp. TaxID=2058762 RepID=UPI003B5C6438
MGNFSKFMVLIWVMVFCTTAYSQKGMGESDGLASQKAIPDFVTLKGTVQEIKRGPCTFTVGKSISGTHLLIKSDEAVFNVHLGPTTKIYNFVSDSKDSEVEVTVFRTKKLPNNHYIAKELVYNKDTLMLRDGYLKPFWANRKGKEL